MLEEPELCFAIVNALKEALGPGKSVKIHSPHFQRLNRYNHLLLNFVSNWFESFLFLSPPCTESFVARYALSTAWRKPSRW